MLRAVIFDLDGTLVNCPYDFAAMRQAIVEIGRRFGLPAEKLASLGILEAIREGEGLLALEVGKRFRAEAEEAVLALELAGLEHSFPLPGAEETLLRLRKKNLKIGIITRNSAKVVETLLGRAEFPYDALLTREAVAQVKPHPGHVRAMLECFGCRAMEAVMVGDHIWDMTAGKEAGVMCVGVSTGTSPEEALYKAGAEVVLEKIADLPGWLEKHFSFPGGKSG